MARQTDTILVVDLEATCWDTFPPAGMVSEIIEIGLCELTRKNDTNTWEIGRSEGILIKPIKSKVSDFCTSLTTLTQKQLDKEGMDFFYACKRLEEVYNSHRVGWASWGDYDRLMFERQCKWPDPKFPKQNWSKYPFSDTHWNMKSLYSLIRKLNREIGMAEALRLEGLMLEGTHHRGVDDAYNTARILQRLL